MIINGLFTSESVSDGHPDKICDQISDAILDECLSQDPLSRVAVEVAFKNHNVVIMGEITSNALLDIKHIVHNVLKHIGHTNPDWGINISQLNILDYISKQSPDIALGINDDQSMGAGDQGIMFGFACNDTKESMPMPISIAHKLMRQHRYVRQTEAVGILGSDAKAQVTIEYKDGMPYGVSTIVLSTQHNENVSNLTIRSLVIDKIIKPIISDFQVRTDNILILVNPTGKFILGGPIADAGLTGRKIIVDTYGGYSKHGGGAFSGKDPTKVDRAAAYAARHLAKTVVVKGLASVCEVRVAYAIGVPKPLMLCLEYCGTEQMTNKEIINTLGIDLEIAFSPYYIIKSLNLQRPIYRSTSTFGHFGYNDYEWEKLL